MSACDRAAVRPLTGAGVVRGKRALDLFLLALAAPPLLAIAALLGLLVWAADGRPILFSQPRLGRGGRVFRIWKLRTMTLEPDAAARRPTRLGGWLRQRGLDELPQLLNVLWGDMSLVGPRPLAAADAQRLAGGCPDFSQRLAVPPGLTGLAQVCLARGAAQTAALDAYYARHRSFAMDLAILLRTAWMNLVGKRRGARPPRAGHAAPSP
jgi:lipopolysaccharide/colanic/teichoic acid biosynthesis glycosyltransferase